MPEFNNGTAGVIMGDGAEIFGVQHPRTIDVPFGFTDGMRWEVAGDLTPDDEPVQLARHGMTARETIIVNQAQQAPRRFNVQSFDDVVQVMNRAIESVNPKGKDRTEKTFKLRI